MNSRIFIIALAAVGIVSQVRANHLKTTKICESIVDCEACLVLSDCYAPFRPNFQCMQYPVAVQKTSNGTLIVEHPTCCPTSPSFDAVLCGFDNHTRSFWTPYTEYLGYMAAAILATVMTVILGIGLCIYARNKRRVSMSVSAPRLTSARSRHSETTTEVAEGPMNVAEEPNREAQRTWNESLV